VVAFSPIETTVEGRLQELFFNTRRRRLCEQCQKRTRDVAVRPGTRDVPAMYPRVAQAGD